MRGGAIAIVDPSHFDPRGIRRFIRPPDEYRRGQSGYEAYHPDDRGACADPTDPAAEVARPGRRLGLVVIVVIVVVVVVTSAAGGGKVVQFIVFAFAFLPHDFVMDERDGYRTKRLERDLE